MNKVGSLTDLSKLAVKLAEVGGDVKNMDEKIDEINGKVDSMQTKMENNYATKEWCQAEFGPTTKILNYILITAASTIVIAVATFIIRGGLIIK